MEPAAKMQRVTLRLEFVSPCFLGGGDPNHAEWRAASVRGQLRWWFRVVSGRYLGELEKVREAEQALFGSTARRSLLKVRASSGEPETASGGPAEYGPTLRADKLAEAWKDPASEPRLTLKKGASHPIHYLGYGPILWNKKRQDVIFERGQFEAERRVELQLSWLAPLPGGGQFLKPALWCWLNLGGIGARSRRGFGSLRCLDAKPDLLGPPVFLAPPNREQLRKWVCVLLDPNQVPLPSPKTWPVLSSGTRVYLGRDSHPTWTAAATAAGAWLIAFRRRYGSIAHKYPSADPADYEWAAPAAKKYRGQGIPHRAGFGLPLPFGDGGETVTWGDAEHDRRSGSPLLIHIACFGQTPKRKYLPVLTYLPSALVPPGKELYLKGWPNTHEAPNPKHQTIVTEFLQDLATKRLVEEVRG